MKLRSLKSVLSSSRFQCLFFLFLGLTIQFSKFFRSGFDLITGDDGDNRLIALLMENAFQQLRHLESLLHLNMFYPAPNAIAYSDTFIGIAPIYVIFRALSFDIFLSFEFTTIVCSVLNYMVFAYVVRFFFNKASSLLVWSAAFIFAFNSAKNSHLYHFQLLPHFYVLGAFYGYYRFIAEPEKKRFLGLLLGSLVCQFYLGFYYFWFTGVSLMVVSAFLIARDLLKKREQTKIVFKESLAFKSLGIFAASALIMYPLLVRYLSAIREVGPRAISEVKVFLPRIHSWLLLPGWLPSAHILPWLHRNDGIPMAHEHWVSPGTFTVIFGVLVLLIKGPKLKPVTKALCVVALFWFVVATYFPSIDFTLWQYTVWYLPGGRGVRAVARLGIFLSFFWAFLFLEGCEWLSLAQDKRNWKFILMGILAPLVCLEQLTIFPIVFSRKTEAERIGKLAESIPKQCKSIYYKFPPALAGYGQLDGIRAAYSRNLNAINGYSGSEPPGYNSVPDLQKWFSTQGEVADSQDCVI